MTRGGPARGVALRPSDLAVRLDAGLSRAVDHLLALQKPEGYWWGELESNCSMHAEYLLLTHFLTAPDPERWRKIVAYLRRQQLPDGGWPVWHGGPADLNITVEAYFAMKLAGVPVDDPAMVSARRLIRERGGLPRARVFTKLWLALFGQWSWGLVPSVPPEIMFLPPWSGLSIYEFASWARATIVACSVLLAHRPVCPIPASASLDELYPDGSRLMRRPQVTPRPGPVRRAALRGAERWLLDRQEADGTWAGIQPPWVYSIMALKTLGYPLNHPVMQQGLKAFDIFGREDEDTWRMDPCISPVWDTALALLALTEAGLDRRRAAVQKSARWLIGKQVLHRGGGLAGQGPAGPARRLALRVPQ